MQPERLVHAVVSIADQPPPVPNDGPAIVDLVLADLTERKQVGIARYGVALQAHNGRDALIDAYQEALDLTVYLRQAIEERDSTPPEGAESMTQPTDDLNDLEARVAAMQATNDLGVNRLAQRGIGVNVPGVRLDELTGHLLGDMDDPRRLAYEERVQNRFAEIIAEAESQVARSVLLEGVNGRTVPPIQGRG